MKYCCSRTQTYLRVPKTTCPNIRIIKLTSKLFLEDVKDDLGFPKVQSMFPVGSPYRFHITMGYEGDFGNLPTLNINFCPHCGVNLFEFYNSDEYVHEVEGKGFFLEGFKY